MHIWGLALCSTALLYHTAIQIALLYHTAINHMAQHRVCQAFLV